FGTASSSRRSASACAAIEMNSLPRWLISITDIPEPCQSSISAAACDSTSSGSAAGPALKLNTLFAGRLPIAASAACVSVAVAIAFVLFALGDALDARELRALVEVDQYDALGRSAHLADLLHAGAYQDAAGRDQHDLGLVSYEDRADELSVPLARLDRDHALRAAAVARVLGDRRALAEAVLGRGEHGLRLVGGDQHRDHALPLAQAHAAHAARLAAHRAHVVLGEAHRLARVGEQHHVVLAVGDGGADQVIAVVQLDRDDALLARVGELRERRLLHRPERGRHEDEVRVVVLLDRQDRRDLLALAERE